MNVASLIKRSLTGLVLVAVMVSCICWGGIYYTLAFFAVALNLALIEWRRLSERIVAKPSDVGLFVFGNLVYFCSFWGFSSMDGSVFGIRSAQYLLICIAVLAVMLATSIFSHRKVGGELMSLVAALYLGLPMSLIVLLCDSVCGGGKYVLMGFFVLIWLGDVFAYLVGSLIGKHKLCPSLSPSKTWEGALGGGIFTLIGGWLWWKFMLPDFEVLHWLLISVLVSVFGMMGDLFESKIKREAGVKDSGNILPGHGGILDRFDSAIMAAPVVFVIINLINN